MRAQPERPPSRAHTSRKNARGISKTSDGEIQIAL